MDVSQLKAQYKAGERNFRGAQLSGVNLVWVNLAGVDLRGADLSHANLSGADLSGADLSSNTNLTFADLSRADLRHTNLTSTRLEGANLESIQLEGAVYDETTRFPMGFDPQQAGAISGSPPIKPPNPPEFVPMEPEAAIERERSLRTDLSLQRKEGALATKSQPNVVQEMAKQARHALEGVFKLPKSAQGNPPSVLPDSTLNPSGQGKLSAVPASLQGKWNWGAFLLPWFWPLTNQVWGCLWIWLLSWIPGIGGLVALIFAITMAVNGNTWAWQSRQWKSIEAFKRHQQIWAIAGFIVWGFYLWVEVTSSRR